MKVRFINSTDIKELPADGTCHSVPKAVCCKMALNEYPVQCMKARVDKRQYGNIGKRLSPFSLTPSSIQDGVGYYGIRVSHRKQRIYGKLRLESLTEFTDGGMHPGTHQDMIIETESHLGDILIVSLGIEGKMETSHEWFVQFTEVHDFTQNKPEVQFPCYHWIRSHSSVTTTSSTTTQKDVKNNAVLMEDRKNQIAKRQLQYQWQYFPETGLPSAIKSSVKELPLDEEFERVKSIDFTKDALKGFVTTKLSGTDMTIDDLHDFSTLSDLLDQNELFLRLAGRWTSDVEFGRQILNGVNPVIIEKCTSIPENFPVTNALVQDFLTRGLTLQQEMEAGRVYICNMEMMDGLIPRSGCFAPAPICLLYVNSSKQLVPIAIQIKQGRREEEKKDPNPIFFPSDHWIDWLLAKTYYQSAHAQFHELSTHYLSCHAAMEAYAMATLRNLPDAHPILKLLIPHFRYTMAINARARKTLINNTGIIAKAFGIGANGMNELLRRASAAYSVEWTNIRKNVKKRRVDDPEQLPGYYYRDDGLKVFEALEEYAKDVINFFYESDEAVRCDPELKNWSEDMFSNAFRDYSGKNKGHGFPRVITSRNALIEYCTVIMFTGSAQHASVNFGQYTIYGYVPNAPFAMRRDPPTEKGVADYQTLIDTLPDKKTAQASMNITFALSRYADDEVYLGDFPSVRFTESAVQRYIERLQKKLADISGEIGMRNEKLDIRYTYMLPTKIPNSITI